MTQEDKELLIKDIYARLPYGVKVQDIYYNSFEPATIWLIDINAQNVRMFADEGYQSIEYIKPYLFPLPSMTDEQIKEFNSITQKCNTYIGKSILLTDFCNKHHIDWRGLIEKELALDATGKNIY